MQKSPLVERLNDHAASLPKSRVYYRESWECDYYDLLGKNFGRIGMNDEGRMQLTVKGRPDENEALREQYEDIVPGYYANKAHWISIYLDSEVISEDMMLAMIKSSYELVLGTFSKRIQKRVQEFEDKD